MHGTLTLLRHSLGRLRGLVAAGQFREALESFRRGGQTPARAEAALLAAGAAFRLGELSMARELARQADQRFNSRADADGRMRSANLTLTKPGANSRVGRWEPPDSSGVTQCTVPTQAAASGCRLANSAARASVPGAR
jgi:hypothetical protein